MKLNRSLGESYFALRNIILPWRLENAWKRERTAVCAVRNGGRGSAMEGLISTSKGYQETFNNVSVPRLMAYAFERVWVLIIFYSIMFYTGSSDVNTILELLYTNLSMSMAVMGLAFLLVGVILNLLRKAGFYASQSTPFMAGAAMAMSIGALLLIVSDLDTVSGAMVLMVSAAFTGIGSACLMHCFFESFSSVGSRTTVLEMSVGTGIALLASFMLVTLPPVVADVVIVICPFCAAALLHLSKKHPNKPSYRSNQPKAPFSRRTKLFFGKALAGAFILGFIEGFYDGFFGYSPTAATLTYDGVLFIAAFIAVFILAIVSTAAPRDTLFHIYKIALALFAVACMLSVAMGNDGLYSSALFFAGYTCFVVLLTAVCVETSESYSINPPLLFGVTFFVLYLGEELGANCNALWLPATLGTYSVATCCIVCMFLLFVASVYLFNEADLVTIGIGELRPTIMHDDDAENRAVMIADDATPSSASIAKDTVPVDNEPETMSVQEAADAIARDYHLSARESEVLPLLLAGRTIGRIQDALFISAGTVSTHIRHIYQKTGVNRKQQLIDLGEQYINGNPPDPQAQLESE